MDISTIPVPEGLTIALCRDWLSNIFNWKVLEQVKTYDRGVNKIKYAYPSRYFPRPVDEKLLEQKSALFIRWLFDEKMVHWSQKENAWKISSRGGAYQNAKLSPRKSKEKSFLEVAALVARASWINRSISMVCPSGVSSLGLFGSMLNDAMPTHGDADLFVKLAKKNRSNDFSWDEDLARQLFELETEFSCFSADAFTWKALKTRRSFLSFCETDPTTFERSGERVDVVILMRELPGVEHDAADLRAVVRGRSVAPVVIERVKHGMKQAGISNPDAVLNGDSLNGLERAELARVVAKTAVVPLLSRIRLVQDTSWVCWDEYPAPVFRAMWLMSGMAEGIVEVFRLLDEAGLDHQGASVHFNEAFGELSRDFQGVWLKAHKQYLTQKRLAHSP